MAHNVESPECMRGATVGINLTTHTDSAAFRENLAAEREVAFE